MDIDRHRGHMLKALEQIGTPQDLQGYQCKVISFSERHLLLDIKIYHEQIPFSIWHLNFVGVFYFEGPVFWKSANFEYASDEVGIDVWRRVHPDLPYIERITKIFPVYTVQTLTKPILIAGGDVSISKGDNFSS